MTLKGAVNILHVGGTEIPPVDPAVTSATSTADDKVRVTFDQAMRATNPGNADDALNPSNYLFTSGVGVARVVVSIALVQASPTIVEITLDGEMTNGVTYNVAVSNVLSVFGRPLTVNNNANFTGQGTRPLITGSTATSDTTVEITFSEEMLNNLDLVDPVNYTFGGPTTLTPISVTRLSGTVVRVVVNEMLDAGAYTVEASNIFDLSQNEVTSATSPFTGVGVGPYLAFVLPIAANEVRVTFSETVEPTDAGDISNYKIYKKGFPSLLLGIASSTQHTPQSYNLLLSDNQQAGVEYTLRADDIRDLVGNTQDPNPDTEDFFGIGVSPPAITITPSDGAADVPIRQNVRVTMADDAAGFSGIDLSSVWIRVDYIDTNGFTHSDFAVLGGVLQSAYVGYTRGAADEEDGITFYFRPSKGTWESRQRYNIVAFARDNESSSNLVLSVFDTALAACFEDMANPRFTVLEEKLLSPTGLPHTDKLRESLLSASSISRVRRVQARTLLWLTTLTDLHSILAGLVDFTLVGPDLQLCARHQISDIHAQMSRLMSTAIKAVEEIPNLRPEASAMLRDRLDNNSPVYVVNAMALIVVSAVAFGEF